MISNQLLILREGANFNNGISLPAGQEIHIVQDVVYINGFPLPPEHQRPLYEWIIKNPNLFRVDTRQF